MGKIMKKNTKAIIISALLFSVLVIFGLIMFHQLKHGDFPGYIKYAREFSQNGYLYKIPHTLLERLIVIIRALLPANILVWISPYVKQVYDLKAFELSMFILMVMCYFSVAIIILKQLFQKRENENRKVIWMVGLATLLIMLVGPIFLFTFPNRMFLGYITGNRYDSPTYVLLKPFALLVFIFLIENLFNKWNWKKSIIMAVLVFCATLAKPNFTISIIPTLGLYLLVNFKRLKEVNWKFIFLSILFPAFIVLLSQFVINYAGDRGDRLLIAPFQAILVHVPNLYLEFILVLLSLLFPLAITILNWKKVNKQLDFQLGWLNFIIALIIGFVLAEEIYLANNNVWNSPMIAIFLIFFVTVKYWMNDLITTFEQKKKMVTTQIITTSLLGLHLICGIIYYIATLINSGIIVN